METDSWHAGGKPIGDGRWRLEQWTTDFELTPSASEDEVMITRLLEKSIRRTEAVDREALCIIAGEKVSGKVVVLDSMGSTACPFEL